MPPSSPFHQNHPFEESQVNRKCIFLFLLFFVAGSTALWGQANAVDAAVNGYVLDPSKSAITGAHEKLTNVSTGISQEATTDGKGYYRFPLVPVGTYRLVTMAD